MVQTNNTQDNGIVKGDLVERHVSFRYQCLQLIEKEYFLTHLQDMCTCVSSTDESFVDSGAPRAERRARSEHHKHKQLHVAMTRNGNALTAHPSVCPSVRPFEGTTPKPENRE